MICICGSTSADAQSSFTVDVEGSSPCGFQSDELEKDVEENLEDSALDPDISDELGQSFSPSKSRGQLFSSVSLS